MAELGDVIGGDIITSSFTNQVKNRSVMRYTTAAARDASIPTPVAGDVAYLLTGQLTIYNGSTWVDYTPGNEVELVANTQLTTNASGDCAISTGFQPSAALAIGTQPEFPTLFVLYIMDSVQVAWRAWDPITGVVRASTTVGINYVIFGS